MQEYLKHHEWQIIEEGFHPDQNEVSESVFSIGNGRMGQRANFEEGFSGKSLPGSYVAGIYYPDKTRVGWWKNGYPEYFAKVLNAPSWIGVVIEIEGERLDLAKASIQEFKRVLDMQRGVLTRKVVATLQNGKRLEVNTQRFCSMANTEIGAVRYAIRPLNFSGTVRITLDVDANVSNKDANYGEKFWTETERRLTSDFVAITAETRKTKFQVCTGFMYTIQKGETNINGSTVAVVEAEKYGAITSTMSVREHEEVVVHKYASIVSSMNHDRKELMKVCEENLIESKDTTYDMLLKAHEESWREKWGECDITIEGDLAAQQGIRYNIFQLLQTYTGEDERLNIGPKGFTGEKYGGSTYWDTEAYCIPFYLSTTGQHVAKNLLLYRYNQLLKAIENAQKLGFVNGAALYPMVTMNGEECHNEWEITFEEIHRNGAIAYAIYDYVNYTEDKKYLIDFGLEVLVAIARFWAQRVNWSDAREKFVILGVTGPNEYENNVNNNWYTNYICVWTLKYTQEVIEFVKLHDPVAYAALAEKLRFSESQECPIWQKIADNMHFPFDPVRNVFLQQDGYLDKNLIPVGSLGLNDRPINQNWSWDRILRSCFIKQADVLQGFYFFEDDFDINQHKRHFDFYEPMTVHESSLSPCVHVILAAKLGYKSKAYELYLRTSRLDLDNYNNDTEDGCHITSMAGTWMSIVKGFGGMRVRDGGLQFAPFIPEQWSAYSFRIEFRGRVIKLNVTKEHVEATLVTGDPITVSINNEEIHLVNKATLSMVL